MVEPGTGGGKAKAEMVVSGLKPGEPYKWRLFAICVVSVSDCKKFSAKLTVIGGARLPSLQPRKKIDAQVAAAAAKSTTSAHQQAAAKKKEEQAKAQHIQFYEYTADYIDQTKKDGTGDTGSIAEVPVRPAKDFIRNKRLSDFETQASVAGDIIFQFEAKPGFMIAVSDLTVGRSAFGGPCGYCGGGFCCREGDEAGGCFGTVGGIAEHQCAKDGGAFRKRPRPPGPSTNLVIHGTDMCVAGKWQIDPDWKRTMPAKYSIIEPQQKQPNFNDKLEVSENQCGFNAVPSIFFAVGYHRKRRNCGKPRPGMQNRPPLRGEQSHYLIGQAGPEPGGDCDGLVGTGPDKAYPHRTGFRPVSQLPFRGINLPDARTHVTVCL